MIKTKLLTNFPCIKHIIITEISQVSPHALKGQKLLAQGIALGYFFSALPGLGAFGPSART